MQGKRKIAKNITKLVFIDDRNKKTTACITCVYIYVYMMSTLTSKEHRGSTAID
jgi:hypothetical protein